jgi:hypothetical protein
MSGPGPDMPFPRPMDDRWGGPGFDNWGGYPGGGGGSRFGGGPMGMPPGLLGHSPGMGPGPFFGMGPPRMVSNFENNFGHRVMN